MKNYAINNIRNNAQGQKILTVDIWGTIGESFFGEGITAAEFKAELDAAGDVDELQLNINSGGGYIIEGNAIYNMILAHPAARKVASIDFAASMATIIAMACDEIHMAENGWFMIHEPWSVVMGDAEELRKQAELLDKMRTNAVRAYMRHTHLDEESLLELIKDETWMTADEAFEMGFIHQITHVSEKAAAMIKNADLMNRYDTLPLEICVEAGLLSPSSVEASSSAGALAPRSPSDSDDFDSDDFDDDDDTDQQEDQDDDAQPADNTQEPQMVEEKPSLSDALLRKMDEAYEEGRAVGHEEGRLAAEDEYHATVSAIRTEAAAIEAARADLERQIHDLNIQLADERKQLSELIATKDKEIHNMADKLDTLTPGFKDPDAGENNGITEDMDFADAVAVLLEEGKSFDEAFAYIVANHAELIPGLKMEHDPSKK